MRSALKSTALILVLLALLVPFVGYAQAPCPDDPAAFADCDPEPPPYYVVINRSVEYFDRPASGCQPIILNHPECEDCTAPECDIDIETEVCQYLPAAAGDTLYAMCCNCALDPEGEWLYQIYTLDGLGGCTLASEGWIEGLPPNTGIDLPAPVIVGGLAVLGLGLVVLAIGLRKRASLAA